MGKCGKMWGDMGNVCSKFSDQLTTRSSNCGLWGIWKMWQDEGDMANVCSKVSDQFCQSIFSEDNFAFLGYYFEATTKSNCMRFTNYGCWEVWENAGEDGKVRESLAKQTI